MVTAVGLATDIYDFDGKVTALLDDLGFYVVRIEDIELFQVRRANYDVAPYILELADSISATHPVALAKFHKYLKE